MLPREVRCRFFQEDVFRFQLADAALQLFYPLTVRHTRRQRFRGVLFPVRLHPEPERGIVDFEFPRHLSDRPRRRGVHHHLDGLLLELRSVAFRYPWHLIPFLSGENPMGSPVRKLWSTSDLSWARGSGPWRLTGGAWAYGLVWVRRSGCLLVRPARVRGGGTG